MGVIVVKSHKSLIPQKVLELVTAGKYKTFGMTVVDKDEKGNPTLVSIRERIMPDLSDLQALQKEYLETPAVFAFDTFPQGTPDEDLQPFDLITDVNDNQVLSAFLHGDYNDFAKAGSTHMGAFFAAHEYLRPKLLKLYDLHGADMAKLLAELDDPTMKHDIERLGPTDTSVVFFSATNKIKVFSRNEHKRSFDWGWMSNHLGYEEKPQEAAKPAEPEKKLSSLDKLKSKLKAVPAATKEEPKKEEAAPAPAPKEEEPKKEEEAPAAHPPGGTPEGETEKVVVPAGMTNKQKKSFMKSRLGYIPENYKKLTSINVPKKLKSLQDLKSTTASAPAPKAEEKLPPAPPKEEPKRATPDTPKPVVTPEPLPIIPAADLKKMELALKNPKVVKQLDEAFEEILPPPLIAEMKTETASFNEQIGLDGGLERTKCFTFSTLSTFPNTSLARLVMEWRYRALILEEQLESVTEDKKPASVPSVTQKTTASPAPTGSRKAFSIPGRKTA